MRGLLQDTRTSLFAVLLVVRLFGVAFCYTFRPCCATDQCIDRETINPGDPRAIISQAVLVGSNFSGDE